jgi:hypothetical protein
MGEFAVDQRDVPPGTYRCTKCGFELKLIYAQPQPPCRSCRNRRYFAVDGRFGAANGGVWGTTHST